jgi:hypothetical protein
MTERIGQEVVADHALLSYARRLWGTGEYQAWRRHMRQDVADSLADSSGASVEDHPEEA